VIEAHTKARAGIQHPAFSRTNSELCSVEEKVEVRCVYRSPREALVHLLAAECWMLNACPRLCVSPSERLQAGLNRRATRFEKRWQREGLAEMFCIFVGSKSGALGGEFK